MDDEDAYMVSQQDKYSIDKLYEGKVSGQIDLDEIMVNATNARRYQGLYLKQLSDIWIIDLDDSKITLDVTTQTSFCSKYPNLIGKYGTTVPEDVLSGTSILKNTYLWINYLKLIRQESSQDATLDTKCL